MIILLYLVKYVSLAALKTWTKTEGSEWILLSCLLESLSDCGGEHSPEESSAGGRGGASAGRQRRAGLWRSHPAAGGWDQRPEEPAGHQEAKTGSRVHAGTRMLEWWPTATAGPLSLTGEQENLMSALKFGETSVWTSVCIFKCIFTVLYILHIQYVQALGQRSLYCIVIHDAPKELPTWHTYTSWVCWCVCQEEVGELKRRLTTIDCQLKKSELSRKTLEISNKKLLGFAQVPLCWCSSGWAVNRQEADACRHWAHSVYQSIVLVTAKPQDSDPKLLTSVIIAFYSCFAQHTLNW